MPTSDISATYAHFFLFKCLTCQGYLATVCSSSQGNLEPTDGHSFNLQCRCGWAGNLLGAAALRHWVELGQYIDLTGVPDCSAESLRSPPGAAGRAR